MVALSFYGVRLKFVCLFVFYAYFFRGGEGTWLLSFIKNKSAFSKKYGLCIYSFFLCFV